MKQPLQITFREMAHSDAVEAHIREKVAKLEEFYAHLISCHVVIEQPHAHHQQGKLFRVSIDLILHDGELLANRSAPEHHAHEDAYVAIRDAFKSLHRQLQEFVRKQRGKVKKHETPDHGKISMIGGDKDFGRIITADDRDIYFHRNSLIDGEFSALEIGHEVRFVEEAGDQGPQASSVGLIGKHHIVN
ncbi:MAG: ribosomal subunit interface protein [Psychromonas sp.]|jgi:ribosomal subunit interface protein